MPSRGPTSEGRTVPESVTSAGPRYGAIMPMPGPGQSNERGGPSDVTDGNLLYYGDNLDVMRRHIKDGTVDLVYLDPPSNARH